MKATDDLFVLIKSLSKQEKRYFKIFAAKQESEEPSDYLLLFDAIDALDDYDEELLRPMVKEEMFGYLPQAKHYLYKTILRALNQYNIRTTTELGLNELIQSFAILYKKGLYPQCRKIVNRAKKLALKSENHMYLLQILILEYKLIMLEQDIDRVEPRATAIFDELVRISDSLARRYKYWRVQAKMFLLTRRMDFSPWHLELVDEGRMLLDELPPPDTDAQADSFTVLLYLLIQEHYFTAVDDSEEACKWCRKIVAHVESVPSLRERVIDRYIPPMYNLCMQLMLSRRFDEFDVEYEKLRQLTDAAHAQTPQYNDLHIRMLRLRRLLETGDITTSRNIVGELETQFLRTRKNLRIGFEMAFAYVFAYTRFALGDHAQALDWLNNILNASGGEVSEDIHYYAWILDLLIHYELGNLDTLEYHLVSAARFLSRKEWSAEFGMVTVDLLRHLLSGADEQAHREFLLDAQRNIERLCCNGLFKESIPLLAVSNWIEAKLEKTDFATIMERRHQPEPEANGHTPMKRQAVAAKA